MSVISSTKPDAWTLSPQMTAAPELWRGCSLCVPMWQSIPANIANGHDLADQTTARFTLGQFGACFDFEANNIEGIEWTNFSGINSGESGDEISIFVFAFQESQDGFRTLVEYSTADRSDGWSFRVENGDIFWRTFGGNNGGDGSNVAAGANFSCGVRWVGNSDGAIYLNGNRTQSFSIADTSSGATNLRIGLKNDASATSDESWDGKIWMVTAWNRLLSDNDFAFLHADPFAMLRPAGF